MIALIALLAALAAAAGWSIAVVVQARRNTGALLAEARRVRPTRLTPDALSRWQKDALLRVEDPSFHQHHGVDLRTPGQGLTTITRALVRWIYFERFQPGC